jgi:hypothetical protein
VRCHGILRERLEGFLYCYPQRVEEGTNHEGIERRGPILLRLGNIYTILPNQISVSVSVADSGPLSERGPGPMVSL